MLHDGFCEVIGEGQWLPTFVSTATVSDWANWIQRASVGSEAILVAEVDNRYAGHLTLQPEEWMASRHVAKLGIIVIKGFRNQGVGRGLMTSAEDVALDREYEKIVLSTFSDNELALSLYQSLGYRTVGYRMRHFKMERGYVDEILMEKIIQGVEDRD
jgi:ribosomal protein S18 acetylase RimI-like enzyme